MTGVSNYRPPEDLVGESLNTPPAQTEAPSNSSATRLRGARARAAAKEAEDGLLILLAACEMRIKNAIVIGSIRDGVDFSVEHYVAIARSALLELADQADASSRRFAAAREAARRTRGRGDHVHDYRRIDLRNLTHKHAVNLAVAEELRRNSGDPVALQGLVMRARATAWDEVSTVLQQRLRALLPAEEPDPGGDRLDRIAALKRDIGAHVRPRTPSVPGSPAGGALFRPIGSLPS